MADAYYDVPTLNQHTVFPTRSFSNNNACWYTSVMMVLLFRMGVTGIASTLQIDTLKRLFDNLGLGGQEDAALARECGLEHSPSQSIVSQKSFAQYVTALKNFGPLVMSKPTHVIVVRGAVRNVALQERIVINDPWDGREKSLTLQEFNSSIAWHFPIHFRRSRFTPPSVLSAGQNMAPFKTKY
jgi:hypothetical protein